MVRQVALSIGGDAVRTPRQFERRNPISGKRVTLACAADRAVAVEAAEAAARASCAWRRVDPGRRRALLLKAADRLEGHSDDFVEAMVDELGSTQPWARVNLALAANIVREAAALTTQIAGELLPSDRPGCLSMAVRQPVGVVLGIAPWNAPIALGVRAIATPLACGNSVILKGSERCPRTHALIVDAFIEAGFEDGVVNLVLNAPEDGEEIGNALIDHPAIRRINFTGSTRVGRSIALRAARSLKPVLLELGGKAPLLVLDDADLEQAARAAAFGAFMNQGQICMSTERVIVLDAVADAFSARLREIAEPLRAGDPRTDPQALGALVDRESVSAIGGLIEDALARGAALLAGGVPDDVLMPATILDHVTPDMEIHREETFGPVVAIVRARDERHALQLANDCAYGLTAAVFTRDLARGLRIAEQIESGMCHVNGPTIFDEPQAPFGGIKESGHGRFGGKAGIDAFTELRWITVNREPLHYPF